MVRTSEIQIGKQGITNNFISTLKNNFRRHDQVRVKVLKSAREDRNAMKKYSEQILEKLGKNYTARIIGFIIVLKKWRRAVR